MSDFQFNPRLQVRVNGPLKDEFQNRIIAAKDKHGLTYWSVAEWAGFSGSFLGNVTRYANNISTERVARLVEVIEKLEATDSGSDITALFSDEEGSPPPSASSPAPPVDTIEYALSTLRRHGLGVILVAGTSVAVPVGAVSA